MRRPPIVGRQRKRVGARAKPASRTSARACARTNQDPVSPRNTADDIARLLAERGLPNRRGGLLAWSWIAAAPILAMSAFGCLMAGEWGWFWGLFFSAMTAFMVLRITAEASERRAALLVPELSKEWAGPLIDAMHHSNGGVQRIAAHRLITVLPTLDEEDAARISSARRAHLYDILDPWKSMRQADLACAVIQFASRVGDEHALTGVETLAERWAMTAEQWRVRDCAASRLPELERRIAERSPESPAAVLKPKEVSETASQELSPEAQAWLEEIDAEARKKPGMRFGFLLATWGIIVPYFTFQTVYQLGQGNGWLSLVFAAAGIGASQFYRFTLTPQQAALAAKLASVDDVQAVGPLAEMTVWPDDRIKAMAQASLTRLLPRMKASNAQMLSRDQRTLLYRSLKLGWTARQAEFQIALLKALEQVGDTEALPFVRALAIAAPRSSRQRKVVEAANSCLPYLEACAGNNTHSQTLLRAAAALSPAENLVRPAARIGEVDPELLVRVASPSEPV